MYCTQGLIQPVSQEGYGRLICNKSALNFTLKCPQFEANSASSHESPSTARFTDCIYPQEEEEEEQEQEEQEQEE